MTGSNTALPPRVKRRRQAEPGFDIDGVHFAASALAPALYIVATPIGNLEDISLRALRVLGSADEVWCEDTRVTRKLCQRYAITARLKVYDDHRAAAMRPRILATVAAGSSVALVSDAGTPLISDPGFKLVREAREAGLPVAVIPGPCALTAAASVAGIATDRLHFVGFLPSRAGERSRAIAGLAGIEATLVFYESPGRLAATLVALVQGLGLRDAAIARELTKLHEEVVRAPLDQLAARFGDAPTRGEIVILVAPPVRTPPSFEDIDTALIDALRHASLREAAAAVAADLEIPRRQAYARALELRAAGSGDEDPRSGDEDK